MKKIASSTPVLWFLFLFNLAVAIVAPFAIDGSQGVMTAVGMGVVAIGAGVGLLKSRKASQQAVPTYAEGSWTQ